MSVKPVILRNKWMLVPMAWFKHLPWKARRTLLCGTWADVMKPAQRRKRRVKR